MLISEIITQVKADIQQTGTEGFSDSELLTMCIEADVDFSRFTESVEKTSTATVAANTSLVSLPTDYLENRQVRWSYNKLLYAKTERQMSYSDKTWVNQINTVPTDYVYWDYGAIRLHPIPSSAGTVTFRHAYVRSSLTTTDTPSAPKMWHGAIIDFVTAECFYIMREYENGDRAWTEYINKRSKAKNQFTIGQRTPDTLQTMRQQSNFNWGSWNNRIL